MRCEPQSGSRLARADVGTLGVLVIAALAVQPALAQLSSADLAALRERGQREGWTFTITDNPATQYSLQQLCGVVEPPDWRTKGRFDNSTPRGTLPASYDWRSQSVCTPIRNQGGCGSCWAFGLLAAVESQIAIQDQGDLVNLSEQWLVSCTGLGGCSGAWPGDAANFLLCNGQFHDSCGGYGAVLEADFPYVAYDAMCRCPYSHPYCLTNWAFIGPQWDVPTPAQIKQAILDHGPVTVCLNASDAFQGYGGGVFNACDNSEINHAVALVGWDDNQGPSGVWYLRNSWGSNWGEGGYMRIAYGCCLIGYGALYVEYPGRPPGLRFSYPAGQPANLIPHQATTFQVNVSGTYEGVVTPGSEQLHYSVNDAPYAAVPLTLIAAGQYQATLPAANCLDRLRWYVSAAETTTGTKRDPTDAPASTFASFNGGDQELIAFSTNFESSTGWTVQNTNLTAGAWECGVPAGGGLRGDPPTDYDGSGQCYLTYNLMGDSDVDGGPTRLSSPTFDLSDGEFYQISYARWFTNDNRDTDRLTVEISNNNGANWVTVESVPDTVGWVYHSVNVSDFIAPTAQMKVRFSVADVPSNSITEAAIDAFKIAGLICNTPKLGDLNCDGTTDFADINPFVLALGNPSAYQLQYAECPLANRDINGDGIFDFDDINPFVALFSE